MVSQSSRWFTTTKGLLGHCYVQSVRSTCMGDRLSRASKASRLGRSVFPVPTTQHPTIVVKAALTTGNDTHDSHVIKKT